MAWAGRPVSEASSLTTTTGLPSEGPSAERLEPTTCHRAVRRPSALVRRCGSSEAVGVILGAVGAACSRDADLQAAPARRDCKSLPQPPRVSACSPRSTRQIRIGCASFGGFQGGLHDLSGVLQRSEHGLELGLGLVPFGDGIRTSNDAAARVEFGAVGADAGTAKQHP